MRVFLVGAISSRCCSYIVTTPCLSTRVASFRQRRQEKRGSEGELERGGRDGRRCFTDLWEREESRQRWPPLLLSFVVRCFQWLRLVGGPWCSCLSPPIVARKRGMERGWEGKIITRGQAEKSAHCRLSSTSGMLLHRKRSKGGRVALWKDEEEDDQWINLGFGPFVFN